jgi:CO/xanthine dehydrogenase Mo-binding subunit
LKLDACAVRCVHAEGSGCYGYNGADDVALDAALLARAVPGRPVRLQWMRDDEFAWEPYGSAMLARAKASLDANGRSVDWVYEVWSNTHSTRPSAPGGDNNLLASAQTHSESTGRRSSLARMAFADWAQTNGFG